MNRFETICTDDGIVARDSNRAHIPPIYASSTFVYPPVEQAMEVFKGNQKAFIYSRWDNPSYQLVERKIAALETYDTELRADALLFSSGMAAITALIMSLQLKAGDTILTQGNLYGTTTEMLNVIMQQQGVVIRYTDLHDLDTVAQLLAEDASIKLLYIETPANPTLSCYNLDSLAKLAKQHGAVSAVDNTFATPYLQQPLKHGINYVMHSATKFLNGHGTGLGGLVVGTNTEHMRRKVWQMRKLMGGSPSPFDAFLLNNGIKTLVLRMKQHCQNTMQVAQFLQAHPAVTKVNYPGLPDHPDHELAKAQMRDFGGTLSFELAGGLQAGIKLMNGVKQCILTASIGTTDTLIQHPASMTHVMVPKDQREAYSISDGLIRLSVGIEHVDDIIADLDQALA